MTDLEALEQLLSRFGLERDASAESYAPPGRRDVCLTAKHGGVGGYIGFAACFSFDDNGRFIELNIAE